MRLHSLRFKSAAWTPKENVQRASIVRDFCTIYGCYLERGYDRRTGLPIWIARYVE